MLRALLGRVLRRALRHERVLPRDEGAVAELTLDGDLPTHLELVRERARVEDGDPLRRATLEVAKLEAEAAGVGVALVARLDLPDERDDAGLAGQLARHEGRCAAPRDRRVEEEDREDRRYRERDHEPRRVALPCHTGTLASRAIVARLDAAGCGLTARRDPVAVIVAERARSVLGQRVAVALAVGGAHERGDDFEVPLGHLARLAPEVGEPEVDVELEQVDAGGCLGHVEKRRTPVGRHATVGYGQRMGAIRLGPARCPSRESPEAAVEILLERGYSACELDFETGFWMDYPWAERLGEVAREHGIALSVHAPLFAFPGHPEEKKAKMALGALDRSAGLAAACAAEVVVIHPGFWLGRDREQTLADVVTWLGTLRVRLEQKDRAVAFGVEVMGRVSELGSIDDTLHIAERVAWVRPVIDFAHMHATTDAASTYVRASPAVLEGADAVLEPGPRSTSTSPTSPMRTATRRSTCPTGRERFARSRSATRLPASTGPR